MRGRWTTVLMMSVFGIFFGVPVILVWNLFLKPVFGFDPINEYQAVLLGYVFLLFLDKVDERGTNTTEKLETK